jgi:hypothetical protein
VLVVIVLIGAGTGIFLLTRNSSAGNNIIKNGLGANNTYSSSQDIDLTVIYSSVEIKFNKIQQAAKFPDDSSTTYSFNNNKNYIRVSFNEKQTATSSSYFSYSSSFSLKLPNGNTVQTLKAGEFSGPREGVQRSNWVDFPAGSGSVDLTNLTMILGKSDEAQETFPLKSGADVRKYQPKSANPNSPFKYAGLDMTIKSTTQSYYSKGQQAKTGKVFLTIDLSADNNAQDTRVSLTSDFLRLKTTDATLSPESGSNLYDFSYIKPSTTGVTGTAFFEVTPSPDGKYTLIFREGTNFPRVEQTIQFS